MKFDITEEQRDLLLQQAAHHEGLAAALRELAEHGRPSDARMSAAPVLEGWRWAEARCLTVRGSYHDGVAGHIDANVGSAVANLPDFSAVLTVRGWFILGVPDDVRAPSTEALQ